VNCTASAVQFTLHHGPVFSSLISVRRSRIRAIYIWAPLKTLGFLRRPLAQGCANRNQSCKALILKKNENDAFRFSCALKNPEGVFRGSHL
jgi:hypothetical protein